MVVMNESFSDLTTYLEGYETSTDPMPYVRSLMNRGDVVSGTCAVSSDMGTGTANSEFEFLTGNSMAYFKGNTPYVQFIDTETPSLASLLAGRGYSTMAMHAYERAGYNRVKVYDRLGFETYKGIEDFDMDLDYARGYPTDEANYRQLISYFETVDEPTAVLFFGDHEPRLSNEFYSSWFTDENDLDLETTAQLHKTPFFMWGNYNLNTESIQRGSVVSLNYLSTVLFQTAGVQLSPYQEYLADLRMEHPVITARYLTTAFGDKVGTVPSAFTDSIREYQWLQYNCVFDRAHRIPGFYS